MSRVAIIGSGIAGLVAAHGLHRAGHEVTLFSDRTADQWLNESRPTGTAARFAPALDYERLLGLDHWHAEAPKIEGAHLAYCPTPRNRLATMTGRQRRPGMAIDVRLQSHRWMLELEARGAGVVIESVTVARLDAIAAAHDLTVVAAGKAELSGLFARDAERSVYAEPRRNVAMVVVKGPPMRVAGAPFLGVENTIVEGVGEAVWLPYHHRDAGPCWNLIFEAKPGGPMDVFQGAKTGADALRCARRVIDELVPWCRDWAKDMELADAMGWLVGRVTPTVRSAVARLPSGRVVTCLGDTAVHFDPLAAQGANNGIKMARHLVERLQARGDGALDADWMRETFEDFWRDHGRAAYALTGLMLEPMTAPGRALLLAQYGSDGVRRDGRQAIADAFAEGFADPRALLPILTDEGAARRFIREATGRPFVMNALQSGLGIARAQVRQALGMAPGHPCTTA